MVIGAVYNKATMNSNIQNEIIKTLVFFDLFDHPLTAGELRKNIGYRCSENDLRRALMFLSELSKVKERNGLYYLPGRSAVVEKRRVRYLRYDRKYNRARRVARIFSFVPWIEYIALVNSIGSNNLKKDGDLDLFIIVRHGRLWLSRFLCTGLAKLLRLRPTPSRQADKICLSFWVSSRYSDLESFMKEEDPYFWFWYSGAQTLFARGTGHRSFISGNKWAGMVLPNSRFLTAGGALPETTSSWSPVLDELESWAERFQRKIFPEAIKCQINDPGSAVVVNDRALKLHTRDKRSELKEAWQDKLKKYL